MSGSTPEAPRIIKTLKDMRRIHFNRVYELILTCKGKKIIRYTSAMLLALTLTGCTKSESKQPVTYDARMVYVDKPVDFSPAKKNVECGVMNDHNPIQIATCEKLLDECVECGILDRNGQKVYRKIKNSPSVSRYMELIEECENEENFYDTVGEGDAWCDYCDYVLSPRGECCPD